MKSIKPGRGPSMRNVVGAIFSVLFGVIWTAATFVTGAPFFFPLFGFLFIGLGIFQVVYNLKNATGKNRYSTFDIVDSEEESDPLNEKYGEKPFAKKDEEIWEEHDNNFCPYCGAKVEKEYDFCPECGRKLPEDK